ncbi:MAG: CPBP family intramembrane metalloprotease [Bacteroidota bacterium]|nr:CPBP family intramembrane metalloprotease [Bacteroidota bacterium]
MKQIIKYLKQHLSEDYNPYYYSFNFLFLVICITINYTIELETEIIDAYAGQNIRILYYFMLYAFAYYFSCITYAITFKKNIFNNKWFWIKSLLILFLISFDAAFFYNRPYIQEHYPYQLHYFLIKISKNLSTIVTVILPLSVFYVVFEKQKNNFYGFTSQNIDLKPYWILLLIMVPLVLGASFDEVFQKQYPNLKDNSAALFLGWDSWITLLIFEITYGWDFISVELMFRGFLVIGMAKILGKGAIVPMTVTYAFYHFGKPLGETIGSVFGGYILGIIALYTRSILGGIVVHLGVAWMMELFAWLQKSVPNN